VSYQLQSTLRLACFLPNVLVNESDVLPNNHLKHGFINHTDHSSVCVMFLIKCIISSRTTAQITIDRAASFQTNNNANKRNTKQKSLYIASNPEKQDLNKKQVKGQPHLLSFLEVMDDYDEQLTMRYT